MGNNREYVRLGEVAEIVMGLSPKGSTYNREGKGDPLLNGLAEFGSSYPVPVLYTTAPTRFAEPGDILFCVRGSTTGRMNWADRRYAIGRGIAAVRARTNRMDTYFGYACIRAHLPRVLSRTSGSVFPSLSTDDFAGFEIPWPDRDARARIVCILRALDDKIELNRRMSRTLEAMARALYKSWFVDFDPVRAKMEGRWKKGQSLPGLPADLYDLFPDRLVDSELGPIPDGWNVRTVGDICEFAYGKALREDNRRSGPIPVFGSNGQVGWHDEALVEGPGIVVGRKGNPGILTWADSDFFPIDTTFYVMPRTEGVSLYYLFHALVALDLPSLGADSAVPGLNRNMAYMSQVLLPDQRLVESFTEYAAAFRARIAANTKQNWTLATVRDALLPKLLSGEIDVSALEGLADLPAQAGEVS